MTQSRDRGVNKVRHVISLGAATALLIAFTINAVHGQSAPEQPVLPTPTSFGEPQLKWQQPKGVFPPWPLFADIPSICQIPSSAPIHTPAPIEPELGPVASDQNPIVANNRSERRQPDVIGLNTGSVEQSSASNMSYDQASQAPYLPPWPYHPELPIPDSVEMQQPPALKRPLDPEPGPMPSAQLMIPYVPAPFDPPLGFTGPSGILPREVQTDPRFVPVEDRWRIGFPTWKRYVEPTTPYADAPYQLGDWSEPVQPKCSQGRLPVSRPEHVFRADGHESHSGRATANTDWHDAI